MSMRPTFLATLCFCGLLALPTASPAQDGKTAGAAKGTAATPAKPATDTAPEGPKPLPPGQKKVFEAIVIDVVGTAQARKDAKAKWQDLKVNDVLSVGTIVRTGPKSEVTLRIGINATLLVDRQSRVAIPEIVQEGDVLRTRVDMSFGKTDVKVDRIGLVNDFEVSTPTATLAVRGTGFRIWWDVVEGFRSMGIKGNKLRAIEVRYLNGILAFLSGADSSGDKYKLPALDAFYETYILPLKGAVDEGGGAGDGLPDDGLEDPLKETGLQTGNATRGTKVPDNRDKGGGGQPPPTGQ